MFAAVRNALFPNQDPVNDPAVNDAPALPPVVRATPAPPPVDPAAPTFIIVAHQITTSGRPAFRVSRGSGHLETLYEYEMTLEERKVLWDYRAHVSGVTWVPNSCHYKVRRVLDHRIFDGDIYYLIHWDGEEWQDPVWRSEESGRYVKAHNKIREYKTGAGAEITEEERQAEKPEF